MSAFIYPCRLGRRTWLAASPAPASILLPACCSRFAITIDRARAAVSILFTSRLIASRQPPQVLRSKAASPARFDFQGRRRPASRCLFDHSFSNFKRIQRPAGTSSRTLAQIKGPLVPVVRLHSTQQLRERSIASSQASACVNGRPTYRPAGHHAAHAALVTRVW